MGEGAWTEGRILHHLPRTAVQQGGREGVGGDRNVLPLVVQDRVRDGGGGQR